MKNESGNSISKSIRYGMILKMTIIILFSAMVTTVAAQKGDNGGPPPSGGQGRGWATPETRAKRQTDRMKEQLKLTPAQETKVEAINLKYAKKMDEARKNADPAIQKKNALAIQSQRENEMKGVLNATQYKEYLKMVAEMKERMMKNGSGR